MQGNGDANGNGDKVLTLVSAPALLRVWLDVPGSVSGEEGSGRRGVRRRGVRAEWHLDKGALGLETLAISRG